MIASEVQDRDRGMKAKPKVYADKKRTTKESDLSPGDKVLVKQERHNKLSIPFAPEPHKVVTKTGNCNSVVIKSPDGVQLKRNNTHVKNYPERIVGQEENTTLPVDLEPTESATEQETAKFPVLLRPSRVKKFPEKFKDFVMT